MTTPQPPRALLLTPSREMKSTTASYGAVLLLHRHAILYESHERTTDAPPLSGRDSKLDVRDDLGLKS
jgi:hypothetical protein